MTLILESVSRDEFLSLDRKIEAALKLTTIRTTPEVKHAPVSISYAKADLKVCDATIRKMIEDKRLSAKRGKTGKWEISFDSLNELKIKREAK